MRHSCIPIDTEEGFLLQPHRDGREGAGGSGGDGASYFRDVESACECDACVDGVGRARSPRDGTFKQFKGCQGQKVFWGFFVSLTSTEVIKEP